MKSSTILIIFLLGNIFFLKKNYKKVEIFRVTSSSTNLPALETDGLKLERNLIRTTPTHEVVIKILLSIHIYIYISYLSSVGTDFKSVKFYYSFCLDSVS